MFWLDKDLIIDLVMSVLKQKMMTKDSCMKNMRDAKNEYE